MKMKMIGMLGAILACTASAQDPSKPVLTAGVSVRMPVSQHAVAMPAADALDVKVVAITAEGKVFHGVTVVEPESLNGLVVSDAVYVKVDARAPFQRVLAVLDALRGKQVSLLTAAPETAPKARILPPYGIRLALPQ
jgi:biopolymer transport protein ExbD